MARTKAISLIQSGSTKVDLAELSGLVISNIQKDTLSQGLKSQAYTGNPASGSVEFKRFKNSASQPYGTARTAGKGDAITVPPTTVNLNTHKEIVEEAAKFDLDTFGVGNIMARRADNHVDTVASEFDTAFFAQAKAEGTSYTPASDAGIEDLLEGIIQTLESVKNDYVRGVPRNMIRLVLDPLTYGKARNYLDKSTNNANVDTAAEDFAIFHGVRVYSAASGKRLDRHVCQLLQIGRTGNHDGRRRSCGVCEAWRRPDFLRHRFRFFRIGEHLQPGNRQRRLLRVENCPERISRVKVVILWPSETQALNAPQSN